jgi:predicted DNA-binding transcriptional regulator AlpA
LPPTPHPRRLPRSAHPQGAGQYSLPFEPAADNAGSQNEAGCQSMQPDQRPDRQRLQTPSMSLERNLSRTSRSAKPQRKQTKADQNPAWTRNPSVPEPSRQFTPKKLPQPQEPADADLSGTSGSLDDLSFLRLPEVIAVTGLSKTSIYELIRERNFPSPVRLGPRAVAWIRSEVRRWAVERVQASRSVA